MKRYIYILFLLVLISSCTKKEFNDERPDAKINRLIGEYNNLLQGSQQGWIGYLFPEGGGGYTFKFQFDDKNRVKMYAAMDESKSKNAKESSYRVTADQVVSLYFDTYSYIHELSDPDPDVLGGAVGSGFVSDFEFSFVKVGQDTIVLEGNHNKSELLLVRAKENQGDDYIAKAFTYITEVDKINAFTHYYNKLKVDNKEYGIAVNIEKSTISFYYQNANEFKRYTTEFAVSDEGLILRTPFEDNGLFISALHEFNIDETNQIVNLEVDHDMPATIENVSSPVVIDKDAPRRMYIESYEYYSATGLTVEGKRDFLNLKGIPGYAGVSFIPRYYIDPFDVLFIYFNNGANLVGPYFNTEYNDQGVMTFKVQNLTGQSPGAAHLPKAIELMNVWSDPAGFYVYQTGKNYYDLVSVRDSKKWLRFN